ncbi:MAG TPA: FHA domain-containing protein [Thermoanaerobaculia bacterium]|jgi:pSer/pThr/pTyr-binding forkhead associated (FHA) protein|nr:FHA domain-containing protein [Thermoanaerobaculia bacterium]
MPLIRCPRCGQAYDVPGVIAVRLPNSIATCHCGEWLSGSKAAVLARLVDVDKVREIDMKPYRVDASASATTDTPAEHEQPPSRPRSVRVIARGAYDSVNTVFTIYEHPLWIGRKACHVELDEAELSLRHCSIFVRGDELVVRDADSHMGTFLDGQEIDEAVLSEGVHLLRVGAAMVSVEPTPQIGLPVEPISMDVSTVTDESELSKKIHARSASDASRIVLVCVEGPLLGQEFEIPLTGLVVGREGHVRVPDEFLSRRHFELVRDEGGDVRVRDLGSRNGTFLNTLPARNTKVHSGDEITAGMNRFRVESRSSAHS